MNVQNEEVAETRLAGDEITLRIYADLMDEVRERVAVINSIIENKMAWANQFVEEVLYLQVRLLCEQVAIGCLIAHGDVPTRKIMKSYEPSKIMAAMGELNPNFFPKPAKSELVYVWNQCGAKVHNRFKGPRKLWTPVRRRFPENSRHRTEDYRFATVASHILIPEQSTFDCGSCGHQQCRAGECLVC